MSRMTFDFTTFQYSEEYGDMDIHVSGWCTPDSPGTMYARNGDPGDPPEPGETEFETVEVFDFEGNPVDTEKANINWEKLEQEAREEAEAWYDYRDEPED